MELIYAILKQFIVDNPWLMVTNMTMILFMPVNEILLPYCFGKMITNITSKNAITTLWILIFVLILAQLGVIFRDKMDEKVTPRLENAIKSDMIDFLLAKYNTIQTDTLTTGDIIYKMTKVPDVILLWFKRFNDYIIPYIFICIAATIYFAFFDWLIAIVFLIFVICLLTFCFLTPQSCIEPSRKADEVFSNLHESIEEIVQNLPAILGSNMQSWESQKYRKQTCTFNTAYAKTTQCYIKYKGIMIPLLCILVYVFITRSKYLIDTQRKTKDAFIPLLTVLSTNIASTFWLTAIVSECTFDVGTLANTNILLQTAEPKENIDLLNQQAPFENGIGIISKRVSIHFPQGKKTLLVGKNGKGKSTILKTLMGFRIPADGGCYLKGKWYPSPALTIKEVRNRIGYIPQNATLFNETVLYNIVYGNTIDPTKAIEMCKPLGFDEDFLSRSAGKNGMNLSGGERQMVWCLRIYFKNPEVVLLDEPTSALDIAHKDKLLKLLKDITISKTVVIVTHDPYMYSFADNVIDL